LQRSTKEALYLYFKYSARKKEKTESFDFASELAPLPPRSPPIHVELAYALEGGGYKSKLSHERILKEIYTQITAGT